MATVQSVERAFRILEAIAVTPRGVTDIARHVGLPKSTVARLLATLEDVSAVERAPDGHTYRVGPALGAYDRSGGGAATLVALARPHLSGLTRAVGEAAGLSAPDGYRVHYIDQTESPSPIQVRDWTGELIPMHLVPSGLVIMARWPHDVLDRYLARDLESPTEHSVTEPSRIAARLEEIRAEGTAWVHEELVEGINSVAAAIVDKADRPVGAIHIHGPAYRFPEPGNADEVARLVAEAAERVSAASTGSTG